MNATDLARAAILQNWQLSEVEHRAATGKLSLEEVFREMVVELRHRLARVSHPHEHEALATNLRFDAILYYRDASGHRSERRVTVRELIGAFDDEGTAQVTGLMGFCHLRRAARTFLLHGIERIADPGTGEIAADVAG